MGAVEGRALPEAGCNDAAFDARISSAPQIFYERQDGEHEYDQAQYPNQRHATHHPAHPVHHRARLLEFRGKLGDTDGTFRFSSACP